MHVVVSRVDHVGGVWHGRFDRRLAQQACAQLEVEHRLTKAPRSRAVDVAPGQQLVRGGPADGQLTQSEWRRAVVTNTTPTRVVLTGRVHTAAALAAGRGRAAFETELTGLGVAYQANQASTGRMNGYRFADPAHRDTTGDPVWFKGSQLDKTLSWAALDRRLSDPPLPAGQAPVKRLLQTRAAHDRQVSAAQQAARAGRDRKAAQDRDQAHRHLRWDEAHWTRAWADRGTTTSAKTGNDQTRRAGGIQPAAGDIVNPDKLAAAVDKRRQDKLMAVTLGRPAPAGRPPARGTTPGPSRGYTPPTPDQGRGHSR